MRVYCSKPFGVLPHVTYSRVTPGDCPAAEYKPGQGIRVQDGLRAYRSRFVEAFLPRPFAAKSKYAEKRAAEKHDRKLIADVRKGHAGYVEVTDAGATIQRSNA